MKRIFLIYLLLISCLICGSCKKNDKVTYYHNHGFVVVDEQGLYNDKYYAKKSKLEDENLRIHEIYLKENNTLIDEIILPNVFPTFAIYDDVLYLKYEENEKIYYSYKKIGSNCSINENLEYVNVKDFNGLITINNKLFHSYSNSSLYIIDHNFPQVPPRGLYCDYIVVPGIINERFSISVNSDEKCLTMNSLNSNKLLNYYFPSEVADAKYNYKTNYAFRNWPKWDERDSFFYNNEFVIYLTDDCLYFSYSKYLGEFENANHYCTMPSLCLFSNCKTEILRYNTKNEVIESVAILPDGYRVLKIYDDGALIMKNNLIGEYNFSTKELKIVQDFNWNNYYHIDNETLNHLRIYLNNNRISKIDFYNGDNNNYTNFDYYD